MNRFNVTIQPVDTHHQQDVLSLLLRFLGPDSSWHSNFLLEFGGIVLENLNEQAAKAYANKLREAGAETDVVLTKEGEEQQMPLYKVVLMEVGDDDIQVIKIIREVTGMRLSESKEFSENPGIVTDDIPLWIALKTAGKLVDAGAKVSIEPS